MKPAQAIVLYKLYKDVTMNQDNLDAAGITLSVDDAIKLMAQVDTEVQETMQLIAAKRKRYVYKQVNGKTKRVLA